MEKDINRIESDGAREWAKSQNAQFIGYLRMTEMPLGEVYSINGEGFILGTRDATTEEEAINFYKATGQELSYPLRKSAFILCSDKHGQVLQEAGIINFSDQEVANEQQLG